MIRLISLIVALVLFALGAFETWMFDMNSIDQLFAGLFFFAFSFLPFPDVGGPAWVVRRREE